MKQATIVGFAVAILAAGVMSPALAAGNAVKGQSVFSAYCAACHTVSGQNKIGPHLDGVVGRTAGTVEKANYSKAMAAYGVVWNEQSLDTFLAAPGKAVPGTAMMINLANPQDRADVIAYLKTMAKP